MSDPKEWKTGPETDLAVERIVGDDDAEKPRHRYSRNVGDAFRALSFYQDWFACEHISIDCFREMTEEGLCESVQYVARASGVTGFRNPDAKHIDWVAEGEASTDEDGVSGLDQARALAICRMILDVAGDEDDAEG